MPLTLQALDIIIANIPVDASEQAVERRIGQLQGRLASEFIAWLDR